MSQRSLNAYLDKCLEIIALFDNIFRNENIVTNDLAQQASGFWANRGNFSFMKKPDVPVYQTRQFGFWPMCNATVCFVGSSPEK
jgi:hypothetical protein